MSQWNSSLLSSTSSLSDYDMISDFSTDAEDLSEVDSNSILSASDFEQDTPDDTSTDSEDAQDVNSPIGTSAGATLGGDNSQLDESTDSVTTPTSSVIRQGRSSSSNTSTESRNAPTGSESVDTPTEDDISDSILANTLSFSSSLAGSNASLRLPTVISPNQEKPIETPNPIFETRPTKPSRPSSILEFCKLWKFLVLGLVLFAYNFSQFNSPLPLSKAVVEYSYAPDSSPLVLSLSLDETIVDLMTTEDLLLIVGRKTTVTGKVEYTYHGANPDSSRSQLEFYVPYYTRWGTVTGHLATEYGTYVPGSRFFIEYGSKDGDVFYNDDVTDSLRVKTGFIVKPKTDKEIKSFVQENRLAPSIHSHVYNLLSHVTEFTAEVWEIIENLIVSGYLQVQPYLEALLKHADQARLQVANSDLYKQALKKTFETHNSLKNYPWHRQFLKATDKLKSTFEKEHKAFTNSESRKWFEKASNQFKKSFDQKVLAAQKSAANHQRSALRFF